MAAAASLPPEATQLCCYSRHLCGREKLAGHEYCLRHILEDRSAPYRTCNFSHRGRKCSRPAPKSDRRDGYCMDHSRRTLMSVYWQQAMGFSSDQVNNPSLHNPIDRHLDQLKHYKGLNHDKPQTTSADQPPEKKPKLENNHQEDQKSSSLSTNAKPENKDPLFDRLAQVMSTMGSKALASSEMDSEDEQPTVDNTWCDQSDSDTESVDWSMDSPLRQAGVYSAEEVIRIMREKLIRLQKLYLDQFQRLKQRLKEDKRRYRQRTLAEKEANMVSIHSFNRGLSNGNKRDSCDTNNDDESLTYQKLKDLNHFQTPWGLEAVLHHQLMEKRAKASSSNEQPQPVSLYTAANSLCNSNVVPYTQQHFFKPTQLPKCSYHITSSTKCGETVIPLSKFCLKHILEDPGQILFRKCGVLPSEAEHGAGDDGPCETPIADLLEGAACVFHTGFKDPFLVASDDSKVGGIAKEEPSSDSSAVVVVKEPQSLEDIKTSEVAAAQTIEASKENQDNVLAILAIPDEKAKSEASNNPEKTATMPP